APVVLADLHQDQAVGPAASDAVLQQAKDATVAVLSYSPESLDKDLAAAKSHLTGDFLSYYSQFTDQVVRPAVQTKKVSTTANVVQAAVSEIHPDKAKVLVFVNQTTTSSDRAEPALAASSVVVTMDKVDGKWLISAFDPV
ncbi:MAG TPA: twin-arginine translocation pathway signal, partial [Mycobacterium sp.]|nr:twin-arginine translocation pathway signal [Mycobacterium sp.]